jgi:hypothetical protein
MVSLLENGVNFCFLGLSPGDIGFMILGDVFISNYFLGYNK